MVLSPSRDVQKPYPQPIMHGSTSFLNDRPLRPMINMRSFVQSTITIKVIAFRTIINRRQSQPLFPIVHKERDPPVPLLAACCFISILLYFTITLEFIQRHLRRDSLLWRCRALSFVLRLLPLNLIGQNLGSRVNGPRFLGRLQCQHLCLLHILLLSNIHHVSGKRVPIYLHLLDRPAWHL